MVAYFKVLSRNLPKGTGAYHIYPQPVISRDLICVLYNPNQAEDRRHIPH